MLRENERPQKKFLMGMGTRVSICVTLARAVLVPLSIDLFLYFGNGSSEIRKARMRN